MYLAGIHVAVINSFGYATHANKMILLTLFDYYYKPTALILVRILIDNGRKQKLSQ